MCILKSGPGMKRFYSCKQWSQANFSTPVIFYLIQGGKLFCLAGRQLILSKPDTTELVVDQDPVLWDRKCLFWNPAVVSPTQVATVTLRVVDQAVGLSRAEQLAAFLNLHGIVGPCYYETWFFGSSWNEKIASFVTKWIYFKTFS